jgi:riboflavin kinase/FMN adenylyltransferase
VKITRGLAAFTPPRYPVVTIGNFDGQHVGHQALIRQVTEVAGTSGGTSVLVTFDPHPVSVLAPQVELQFLTSWEEKVDGLARLGVQELLVLGFTKEFAALSPNQFVGEVLRAGIGTREIFVGDHFAFGQGRAGRIDDLRRLGQQSGFMVHSVSPCLVDGAVVSSSRIRRVIREGDLVLAARFLGRRYSITGTVIEGEGRGTELGWPTANVEWPAGRVIPPDGVYAVCCQTRGVRYTAAAYLGTRPTFGSGRRLLEVHLLDERIELYGHTLMVEFVEWIRGDMVFPSEAALTIQIDADVVRIRQVLEQQAKPALATHP